MDKSVLIKFFDCDHYNSLSAGRRAWYTKRFQQQHPEYSKKDLKEFVNSFKIPCRREKKPKKIPVVKVKNWNGKGKEQFRNKVIEYFTMYGNGERTLALETSDLHFVNKLPNHKFDIYEHNIRMFDELEKVRTCNISNLVYGDVWNAALADSDYTYAFLDFCGTFDMNNNAMVALSTKLNTSLFIAVTFSLRRNGCATGKSVESYKVDLVKKIQSIYKNHTIEYEDSYRDGCPMIGMVFKHRSLME